MYILRLFNVLDAERNIALDGDKRIFLHLFISDTYKYGVSYIDPKKGIDLGEHSESFSDRKGESSPLEGGYVLGGE